MNKKIFILILFSLLLYACKEPSSIEELQRNYEVLNNNYKLLQEENNNLKEQNQLLREKSSNITAAQQDFARQTDQVIDKLDNFETTVSDSIAWFKENRNIADFSRYKEIREELQGCRILNEVCQINLTCIYEVNHKNEFKYKYDEASVNKDDYLKNLNLIYDQEGGDCEDFSLLFRAEYNYLVDQCLLNVSREKIIPIVEDKKLAGNYMYIVCGTFDPQGIKSNFGGHCLVAVSKTLISKSSEVYWGLKNAALVEPQTGELVAEMSQTDIIKIFDNGVPPDTLYRLWTVITDDDLKVFYDYTDNVEWLGYWEFLRDARELKEEINT